MRPPPMLGHYGRCPKCDAMISYKEGKHGPFWGCVNYPNCKWSADIECLPVQQNDGMDDALSSLRGRTSRYRPVLSSQSGWACICVICGARESAHVQMPDGKLRPVGWRADYDGWFRCPSCYSKDLGLRPSGYSVGLRTSSISDDVMIFVPSLSAIEQVDVARSAARQSHFESWCKPTEPEPQPSPEPQKEETKMTTENKRTAKETAVAGMKEAGSAMSLGFQLATVKATGDKLLNLAQKVGKDQPWVQAALQSDQGREVLKIVMAGLVQQAVMHTMPTEAKTVQRVCSLQITSSTAILAAPLLSELMDLITSFASIGKQLDISDGEIVPDAQLSEGGKDSLPIDRHQHEQGSAPARAGQFV